MGLSIFHNSEIEPNSSFISDFRELNKLLRRKPWPLPKIVETLQELSGFTYVSQLDLNMGYYTIRLDADSSKICTIILPWGKYSYQRLPMGVAGSPDIFQEKMSGLMSTLEFVRTYLCVCVFWHKWTCGSMLMTRYQP